jgi:Fe-S-cluster containining protein
MYKNIETNLNTILQFAQNIEEENLEFIDFIKQQDGLLLDNKVKELNDIITPKIDCTTCGNCCKSLMINVTNDEANNLANHMQLSRKQFDEKYIETGSSGMMILNKIPCHFLKENKCTVYAFRFDGCKEFPAMHLPNFKERLFTTFMHYNRCPIIFNVIEHLKKELKYKNCI